MNMTERDWEIVLAEQQEAFEALCSKEEKTYEIKKGWANGIAKPPAKADNRNQLKEYIRIEKGTPKAYFFVTHETLGEIHGFWCPKAAIVKDTGNQVEIQHWCKIKIIQFV